MKLTHCVSIVFTGTSLSLINNPSKTFEKMRLTYAKLGRHLFEVAFVLDEQMIIPFRLWKDGKSFDIEA